MDLWWINNRNDNGERRSSYQKISEEVFLCLRSWEERGEFETDKTDLQQEQQEKWSWEREHFSLCTEGQSSGSLTMEWVMDEKFQRMKSVLTDCDRPMYKNFITCAINILYAISTTGYHSHKKSFLFTFVNQAKVSCSVSLSAQTNLSRTWGRGLSKGVSIKISFFRSKRLTFILRRRGSLKNRISKLWKKNSDFWWTF